MKKSRILPEAKSFDWEIFTNDFLRCLSNMKITAQDINTAIAQANFENGRPLQWRLTSYGAFSTDEYTNYSHRIILKRATP